MPVIRSGNFRSKPVRSEEHTSELQSRLHLVCRLLLEKKKHNVVAYSPAFIILLLSPHTPPYDADIDTLEPPPTAEPAVPYVEQRVSSRPVAPSLPDHH